MATKYTIDNPTKIRIKGISPKDDIKGLHAIFKNEGCIDSENLFTDEDKAVALDDVQTRLSHKNKNDKQSSADMLICIVKNKYLLADAKFKQKNVDNLSQKELCKKLDCSKGLVQSDEMVFVKPFYVLFPQKILTSINLNRLKRQFKESPLFKFVNAIEFHDLFTASA